MQYEIIDGITTVNDQTLDAAIKAAVGNVFSGHSGPNGNTKLSLHFEDVATAQERSTGRTIALAHDPAVLSEGQQTAAAQTITRDQIITYLRAQLTSASPDTTAAIKTQVQAYVDSHPKLQNALTNTAALYGHDTGTNAGYLRAAMQMISFLS